MAHNAGAGMRELRVQGTVRTMANAGEACSVVIWGWEHGEVPDEALEALVDLRLHLPRLGVLSALNRRIHIGVQLRESPPARGSLQRLAAHSVLSNASQHARRVQAR